MRLVPNRILQVLIPSQLNIANSTKVLETLSWDRRGTVETCSVDQQIDLQLRLKDLPYSPHHSVPIEHVARYILDAAWSAVLFHLGDVAARHASFSHSLEFAIDRGDRFRGIGGLLLTEVSGTRAGKLLVSHFKNFWGILAKTVAADKIQARLEVSGDSFQQLRCNATCSGCRDDYGIAIQPGFAVRLKLA